MMDDDLYACRHTLNSCSPALYDFQMQTGLSLHITVMEKEIDFKAELR